MKDEEFRAGFTIRAGEAVVVTDEGEVVPVGPRPGLVEFVLARIAEDEAKFGPEPWLDPVGSAEEYTADAANQVLAECEAKRRMVKRCIEQMDEGANEEGRLLTPGANLGRMILRDLASAYADHPHYRDDCRW